MNPSASHPGTHVSVAGVASVGAVAQTRFESERSVVSPSRVITDSNEGNIEAFQELRKKVPCASGGVERGNIRDMNQPTLRALCLCVRSRSAVTLPRERILRLNTSL